MNKYINSDFNDAYSSALCGIMNVLHAFENGELENFIFPGMINFAFILECMQKRGWKIYKDINLVCNNFYIECLYESESFLLHVDYINGNELKK